MQHKRATKHSFFRLKQMRLAIQNRITSLICFNARKLTVFCHTLKNSDNQMVIAIMVNYKYCLIDVA